MNLVHSFVRSFFLSITISSEEPLQEIPTVQSVGSNFPFPEQCKIRGFFEKVLFETHDKRMHPGVEDDIGAFEPDLRGIAGREILHMDRSGDHGAGDAQTLADVALHLRAED